MAAYTLLGFLLVRLGKRFLPTPWNEASHTVPIVVMLGALLTLATFPHWVAYPG